MRDFSILGEISY